MSTPPPTPDVSMLLRDAEWLQSLAHRLVSDAGQADDVIQDAWLSALQRPPRHDRSLRGWWTVVTRNVARQLARSEGARVSREIRAARSEVVADSPADVVERAETLERLVLAVLALDEPYRRVLLWRYFDEREPKEIAHLLGIPAGTVRSQIKRGLDLLRARLDGGQGGERRSWALALIPLALPSHGWGPITATAAGGLIVSATAKFSLAAVAVGLLLLGSWFVIGGLGTSERSEDEGHDLLQVSAGSPPEPGMVPGEDPTLDGSGTPIDRPQTRTIHVAVVDASTQLPVHGARVFLADPSKEASASEQKTDMRGECVLILPLDAVGTVMVEARGFESRRAELPPAQLDRDSSFQIRVHMGPAALLGGLIVSPAGLDLGGVTLEVQSPPGRGGWTRVPVTSGGTFEWKRESPGACRVAAVGLWKGRQWRASRIVEANEAWVTLRLVDIRILMKPVPGLISGRVITPPGDGQPWIVVWRLGGGRPRVEATEVAADGSFSFSVPDRILTYDLFVRQRNAFWPRNESPANISVHGATKDVVLERGESRLQTFSLVGLGKDVDTIPAHLVDFRSETPPQRVMLRVVDGRVTLGGLGSPPNNAKLGVHFGPTLDGRCAWWVGRMPDEESEIRVELPIRRSARGRILPPPNVRLRGPARLQRSGLGEVLINTVAAEDLDFEVKGVMPNVLWGLRAEAVALDGRLLRSARIWVYPGDYIDLRLEFVK